MFSLISDYNFKTTILDATTERENLNCISKVRLFANITYYIDLHLIFHNVHINNLTIVSNIKFNL